MNNKQELAALSMDLMRVALGYHANALKMADRFLEEARKRTKKMETLTRDVYLQKLLSTLGQSFQNTNQQKVAEDALMYSSLFQLYALKEE